MAGPSNLTKSPDHETKTTTTKQPSNPTYTIQTNREKEELAAILPTIKFIDLRGTDFELIYNTIRT